MQVRIRLPSFPQWQVWSCILRCCQSFHFWVILLLIAATVVSFLTSGFGEKIRQKRNDYFGENVSRLLGLSSEMSDAAKGKDVRLYQMHPWVNHYYNIYNKN